MVWNTWAGTGQLPQLVLGAGCLPGTVSFYWLYLVGSGDGCLPSFFFFEWGKGEEEVGTWWSTEDNVGQEGERGKCLTASLDPLTSMEWKGGEHLQAWACITICLALPSGRETCALSDPENCFCKSAGYWLKGNWYLAFIWSFRKALRSSRREVYSQVREKIASLIWGRAVKQK